MSTSDQFNSDTDAWTILDLVRKAVEERTRPIVLVPAVYDGLKLFLSMAANEGQEDRHMINHSALGRVLTVVDVIVLREEEHDFSRCDYCGWPLKESDADGCSLFEDGACNCSQRPRPEGNAKKIAARAAQFTEEEGYDPDFVALVERTTGQPFEEVRAEAEAASKD